MESAETPRARLGPLVHRSVHQGAILFLLGSIEFLLGMAVTQVGYGPPAYSLTQNYISDLGATKCGVFHGATSLVGHYACSPWHVVFNASIVLLGLLLIFGAVLVRSAFPPRRSRNIGLLLLILAGIGAMGVGFSPEDVDIAVHSISAFLAFSASGFALIVLGFAMFRDTRWDGFRAYSILSGLLTLVALVLFASKVYGPLGVGGMERLIVAPVLLWAIVVGVHLLRIPAFAPRSIPKPTGT